MKYFLCLITCLFCLPLFALPPKDEKYREKIAGERAAEFKRKQRIKEASALENAGDAMEQLFRMEAYQEAVQLAKEKVPVFDLQSDRFKKTKSKDDLRVLHFAARAFLKMNYGDISEKSDWATDVLKFCHRSQKSNPGFREAYGIALLTNGPREKTDIYKRVILGLRILKPLAQKRTLTSSGWWYYLDHKSAVEDAREVHGICTDETVLKMTRMGRIDEKNPFKNTPCDRFTKILKGDRPPAFKPSKAAALDAFQKADFDRLARDVIHLKPHLQDLSTEYRKKTPDRLTTYFAVALAEGWLEDSLVKKPARAADFAHSTKEVRAWVIEVLEHAYLSDPENKWFTEALAIGYAHDRLNKNNQKLGYDMLRTKPDLTHHGYRALLRGERDQKKRVEIKKACAEKAHAAGAPDWYCQ